MKITTKEVFDAMHEEDHAIEAGLRRTSGTGRKQIVFWILLIVSTVMLAACSAQPEKQSFGGALGATPAASNKELVVAKDGSGDYMTVQEAVYAAKSFSQVPVRIFIKNGVYTEQITVPKTKPNLRFVGESKDGTILTYTKITGTGFNEPATTVHADLFSAENLTFANGAGTAGTGPALVLNGDRGTFVNIRLIGYQDTLFLQGSGKRQYFKNCYVEGAVDFIYGAGIGFFDGCILYNKRSGGYITAASTPREQEFGLVFWNCTITGDAGLEQVYLGRPWRDYAQVAFIHTMMDPLIHPAGWHNWNSKDKEKTARYVEIANNGPGAETGWRVPWSKQPGESDADSYSKERVLAGKDGWKP